jgi:hypothetical protein
VPEIGEVRDARDIQIAFRPGVRHHEIHHTVRRDELFLREAVADKVVDADAVVLPRVGAKLGGVAVGEEDVHRAIAVHIQHFHPILHPSCRCVHAGVCHLQVLQIGVRRFYSKID